MTMQGSINSVQGLFSTSYMRVFGRSSSFSGLFSAFPTLSLATRVMP